MCWSIVVFRYCNNVGQAGISPCQVDHRESDRDQDAEDGQGPSDQTGAGPIPPQGNHTTQLCFSYYNNQTGGGPLPPQGDHTTQLCVSHFNIEWSQSSWCYCLWSQCVL